MGEGMRTIGLLGGMSWESSALYYRVVNEAVRERLGGYHSARVLMSSVDFADVERLQVAGEGVAAEGVAGGPPRTPSSMEPRAASRSPSRE